ncbi:MAG: proton-conducting transporter membrane subunit, partial [Acidimicrobiales bacterium]
FTVIAVVGQQGERHHDLDSYRGLARRQPALALAFAILLLAQAGVPFTTGFLGKLYVVEAAIRAHSYALGVIAMLSGAVAAAYYLRVVFLMYGTDQTAQGGAGAGAYEPAAGVEAAMLAAGAPAPAFATAGGTALAAATASAAAPGVPPLPAAGVERGPDPAHPQALDDEALDDDEAPEAAVLPDGALPGGRFALSPGTELALFVTVAFTVVLGIWPSPLFDFAHAASLLF